MKFKLFGGLDCPDWFLAMLATVSDADAHVVEVAGQAAVAQLSGDAIAWSAIDALELDGAKAKEILGCLHMVLANAVRFDVDARTLEKELMMLGVSEEPSAVISGLTHAHRGEISARGEAALPRGNTVVASGVVEMHKKYATLDITTGGAGGAGAKKMRLDVDHNTLKHLEEELRTALARMEAAA